MNQNMREILAKKLYWMLLGWEDSKEKIANLKYLIAVAADPLHILYRTHFHQSCDI